LEIKTFAETTLNVKLPKKYQAIVFESINNVPQIKYIIAISQIILPKNIKYVSRILHNRFCIFLNDKNTVDFLIDNRPKIKLNDHILIKIRRLVNPAKSISNVPSANSNDIIIVHSTQNHNIQL